MTTLKIRTIKAVFEEVEGYRKNMHKVTSSHDVYAQFQHLKSETKEYFICLHMNSKNEIMCQDVVSIGSLNAAIVHPREVYKTALLSSAASVLFIHNHPSGDIEPSGEDLELTKRLKECGDLLGIRVLDHIIIGDEKFYSFADSGNLT